MAARATLHRLTGCAIGEILGMVIGTALGWGNAGTMILAIVLAFLFGYTLTLRSVLKAGVDVRTAFRVALAADTLSIAVMELVDNGVIALRPGPWKHSSPTRSSGERSRCRRPSPSSSPPRSTSGRSTAARATR
jgi:Zn-dependent protease